MPELRTERSRSAGWLAQHGVLLAVCLVAAAVAVPLSIRSITLSDEGYLLTQALEITRGQVLYRDLDAFVTPGVWLVLAATFKLFGASVFVSRMPALAVFIATAGLCYRIVERAASWKYGVGAVAALLVLLVWAFPTWTWSFYSPFAVCFALLALYGLLSYRASSQPVWLFVTGFCLGLSIVFKQNYGVFATAGTALTLALVRIIDGSEPRARFRGIGRDAALLTGGTAAVGLPVVLYLVLTGSLDAAFQSLVIRPFTFAVEHATPYLGIQTLLDPHLFTDAFQRLTYSATAFWRAGLPAEFQFALPWVARMHVVLYWLGPVVLATGLAQALWPMFRKDRPDEPLLATSLVSSFLFLGVLPRADFNHLINVYQPVVVVGSLVVHRFLRLASGRPRVARLALAFVSLFFVSYGTVSFHWYRTLIRGLNTPLPLRRAGVLVEPLEAHVIDFEVSAMRILTDEGEPVLAVPDLAMLNFLAERPASSGFQNMYEVHIGHDRGAAVVRASEQRKVRLAIVRTQNWVNPQISLRRFAPALADYLRSHFDVRMRVRFAQDLLLWRRAEPHPTSSILIVSDHCTLRSDAESVYEGSWFPTLEQDLGDGSEERMQSVKTECPVVLPDDSSELAFMLDYRHPIHAEDRPANFRVSVNIRTSSGTETLLSDEIPITPHTGIATPPPVDYRLDVGRFAGQPATLELETTRVGPVKISPYDGGRFVVSWHDLSINRKTEGSAPRNVVTIRSNAETEPSEKR